MHNNNFRTYKHCIAGFSATLLLAFTSMLFAQGPGGPGPGPNNNGGQNLQPLGNAPVPNENPITESKRILGKILFWDEQLSSDDTVACGTCHKPAAGGADTRLAINPGFDQIFGSADDIVGSPGIRALDENGLQLNDPMFGHDPQVMSRATPSFFTSMFADSNFWDGRATDEFVDPLNPNNTIIEEGGSLESQAIGPILSTVEMAQQGRDWDDVVGKLEQATPLSLAVNIPADMVDALQGGSNYSQLFSTAFGDSEITPVRIAMAIATYERTLVPNETPWDLYIAGDNNAMTTDQIQGWELFSDTPCANCHEPPLFSDNNFRNIGLRPAEEDLGQFEVSGQNNDRGDFKTPSLRNVGLRSALMHVGWITDVSDAIDFYNAGTNNTGHVQFTQDQSGIPGTGVEIDNIDVFGDDPVRRGQVIEFLTHGLTDPRVAAETFPFDRPTLSSEADTSALSIDTDIAGLSSQGAVTQARFSGSVMSTDGSNSSGTFSSSEVLAIIARIEVDPADVGISGNIYCVIVYQGAYYAINGSRGYQAWNGDPASLPALEATVLGSIENISIAEQLTQASGEFAIYIAYDTNDGVLRYNSVPIQFSVN
jgi:cytochrome c peroxidase